MTLAAILAWAHTELGQKGAAERRGLGEAALQCDFENAKDPLITTANQDGRGGKRHQR
jgi:hypothetical protein